VKHHCARCAIALLSLYWNNHAMTDGTPAINVRELRASQNGTSSRNYAAFMPGEVVTA
jgi:hypothetical protein